MTPRKVTIAGGGIAALEAVLALRALAGNVSIEMLAPGGEAEYRPLAVLEPFGMGEMPTVNLARFAAEQDVELNQDTLAGVEADENLLVTGSGRRLPYEILVVAAGARAVDGCPGALSYRGHEDRQRIGVLADEASRGEVKHVTFIVPEGQAWSLPAYELALLTAASARAHGTTDVEVQVVTPEQAPLELFGAEASAATRELLDQAGIAAVTGTVADRVEDGSIITASDDRLPAGSAVALPRLVGPAFPGLPSDDDGFIPTDAHGLVFGLAAVYAAGDVTNFPIKQGGLATQQADAVAEAIAARVGGEVEPQPFQPVLRGQLLVGAGARAVGEDASEQARPLLFAASRKVVGRYLLPYLAGSEVADEPDVPGALQVEVDVEPLRPA